MPLGAVVLRPLPILPSVYIFPFCNYLHMFLIVHTWTVSAKMVNTETRRDISDIGLVGKAVS